MTEHTPASVVQVASVRGQETAPVHALLAGGLWQTWCGVRPQFRHRVTDGTAEDATCGKCKRALRRGHPYARGS